MHSSLSFSFAAIRRMPRDSCFLAMAVEETICPSAIQARAKRHWRRAKIKTKSAIRTIKSVGARRDEFGKGKRMTLEGLPEDYHTASSSAEQLLGSIDLIVQLNRRARTQFKLQEWFLEFLAPRKLSTSTKAGMFLRMPLTSAVR